MLFCPKCGSIMMPKQEKGKNVLSCSCGYKKENNEEIKIKEVNEREKEREIEVADEEQSLEPLIDAECPKCRHGKAHNWIVQTRAADEPPTRFFKCEKCKHTWREYK
ncbi:transcription factor S [Candidatus Woesearchaeota archaeon]|nr:transcription factor S [Candidatus Woesearchaeota archaeon]